MDTIQEKGTTVKIATGRIQADEQTSRMDRVRELGANWAQFGEEFLFWAEDEQWNDFAAYSERDGLSLLNYERDIDEADLHLVTQKGRIFQQVHPEMPVLLDKGRFLVVELNPEQARSASESNCVSYTIQPLERNTVVFELEAREGTGRRAPIAWVQTLVDNVTRSSFESALTHLVSYPTRYSTSTQYTSAATWAMAQLDGYGYSTRVEAVPVGASTSLNVIAEKNGSGILTRGLILVVAHLDSVNSAGGPLSSAPGADDNASGSAGLLEIARVLRSHAAIHDIRFVLFGGEEQGLLGSRQFVTGLSAAERARIRMVINMDMIASLNTIRPTVLLEGARLSEDVMDALADAAATYTSLIVQTSLRPHASDHVSFIDAAIPAVLTIEGADSANGNIHTAADTLATIHYDLALEILRMNVATIAFALGNIGGILMNINFNLWEHLLEALSRLAQLSGRYTYPVGRLPRLPAGIVTRPGPAVNLVPDSSVDITAFDFDSYFAMLWGIRFTLHIDIDGPDPLGVVSGSLGRYFLRLGGDQHFIGRVTSDTYSGSMRNLVVEDLSIRWPGSRTMIDRLEISIVTGMYAAASFSGRPANVTFIETATSRRFGPYEAQKISDTFRDVEVDVDVEENAVAVEPYNTHTHPDRPADIPNEDLTLERAYRKAGISISRSSGSGSIIPSAEAGVDNRWTNLELHDSMEMHWAAFANNPQWKMWIFLAELASDPTSGGVMFDGEIDEPGGVDRQGTAVFTLSHRYHSTTGDYIVANPPTAEAIRRELFFNLMHESGHAFNLYHSFRKTSATPWMPPFWMPLANENLATSWMNYPERASSIGTGMSGDNATYFYRRFRFQFDNDELLFMRHAPASFVQMGNSAWGVNHARVPDEDLDRRLELVVRSQRRVIEMGEPVFVELRLRNVSAQPVLVSGNLEPESGMVEVAITNPRGERKPFIPFVNYRKQVTTATLEPGEAIYQAANFTMGRLGFPFKEVGMYLIEVSYTNLNGGAAVASMQLYVRPPQDYEDIFVVNELFNARMGRAMYVGGTRVMEDVNDKLDWILARLDAKHPLSQYLMTIRYLPLAEPVKVVEAAAPRIKVYESDPERVVQELEPLVKQPETLVKTVGNITYHEIVDKYTDAARAARVTEKGCQAQEVLLRLLRKQQAPTIVLENIKKKIEELE